MNRSVFRFLSLFLCFAMLFTLAACGKDSEDRAGTADSGAAGEETFTPSWGGEFVTLQTDGSLWGLRPVLYTDDGFYATASMLLGRRAVPAGQVEEYEGQYDVYGTTICFVENSGKVTPLKNYVPDQPAENTYGYRDFYSYCTPGSPVFNSDGHLALLETREAGWSTGAADAWDNAGDPAENTYHRETGVEYLILDTDGTELSRARVAVEPGDRYLNISSVAPGPDGSILATMETQLLCIGTDGSVLWTADAEYYLSGLITLADGAVAVMSYDEDGNSVVRSVDTAAHTLGEARAVPSSVWSPVPGNGEYDLFFSGGLSLYGLRIGESPEQILNWLDCDINGQTLDAGALTVADDGTVRGLVSDVVDGREVTQLFTLRPVSEGSAQPKAVLSFAQLQFYPDYSLVNRVIRFNRSRSDVRIVFRDYSVYNTDDSLTGSLEALQDDILSGNAPDLFTVDGLAYRELAALGLLEDLYPYLDADKELSRGDFFPNVLSLLECGGGLYQCVPGFSVDTLIAPSSLVGDTPGWTWEEFFAARAKLADDSSVLSPYMLKDEALSAVLSANYDRYVDWQNGESDFESDEFKQLLRFVQLFPDEVDWEALEDYSETASFMADGRQMLAQYAVYSPEAPLWNDSDYDPARFTCIGWPGAEGTGSVLWPDTGYAMSSACRHKDAGWDFLREFLTEAGQQTVGSLPVNRKVLQARLQELMTEEYRTGADGTPLLDAAGQPVRQARVSWYDEDGTEHNIYSLTQEQADRVLKAVEGCTHLAASDSAVFSLVREQAELLFSGELSVDDAARLIQSRVSNYMHAQLGEP